VYRAQTTIQLESPPEAYYARFNATSLNSSEAPPPAEAYVQNEIRVLESESLAKRVAAKLDTAQSTSIGPTSPTSPLLKLLGSRRHLSSEASSEELKIRSIQNALTVRPSLKSQVVTIFFKSSDPERAAVGANAVVSEYIALNREAQAQAAKDTGEWLSSQIVDLRTKLDHENEQLKAFADASGLPYSSNQNALIEQRVAEIQDQLTKAEADRAAKQSRYDTARSNPADLLPTNTDSNLLREYESNLAAAEKQLIEFQSIYTPGNYKVIDAESKVAQIRAGIERERQRMVERTRTEYEAAARLQHSLQGKYLAEMHKLQAQSSDVYRFKALQHELENTQQLYDSLLQKTKEAGVASALQVATVRLIDPARVPKRPYSPNRLLNAAVGVTFGLLLGSITILIRGRNAVLSKPTGDTRASAIRELGDIPKAGHRRLLTASTNGAQSRTPLELTTWHTESALTDSYFSVLTSILFSGEFGREHRILTVTSVAPQEGKTTVISNLAIALAETEKRVLLVDADLRHPSLHNIFQKSNDRGLTSVVVGSEPNPKLAFDELPQSTWIPNLFLIPSGPGAPSINSILRSGRLGEFLRRARQEFDYVLIDTPPTSLFSDARLLGRIADAVVLVCDVDKTSRDEVELAYRQLREDGAFVLGAIRNRCDDNVRHRSYSHYYRHNVAR
jgi:capsular exopolysaccharide synthesis family protein